MNDDARSDEWEIWLAEHGPMLVLFARQWVSQREIAEDVVQEAFVRFWEARDQARDPRRYLYTCVKNCAIEWLRADRRRRTREKRVARSRGCEESDLFVHEPENAERVEAVEAALTQLPADQRRVLVLRIWGEFTFPKIGKILGISQNTAASRYRYALASLRGTLAEETLHG